MVQRLIQSQWAWYWSVHPRVGSPRILKVNKIDRMVSYEWVGVCDWASEQVGESVCGLVEYNVATNSNIRVSRCVVESMVICEYRTVCVYNHIKVGEWVRNRASTLTGFKSLWMKPELCTYISAETICLRNALASLSCVMKYFLDSYVFQNVIVVEYVQ